MLTVQVLGPVEVHRDGRPVELGGPQQRAVIAHLALDAGRVVSVERLVDRLWGDEPPRTPLGTLQSYVSRLRRAIEPERGAGAAPQVLVSEAPGYVLQVPPERIDVHRFRQLVATARAGAAAGRTADALRDFDEALALWRGPALAGVGPDEQVRAVVVRLDEEHQSAIEDRFAVTLALGRHAEAVPALQAAVDEHPMRERLWGLLALALYRSSRQADALRALAAARERLLDELGLDPGPELRELESRILAQDPALDLTPHEAASVPQPLLAEQPVRRIELVERPEEWQALTTSLAAAGAGGGGRLALVEGEPGIGKSTLCAAFLAEAETLGWRTAAGRCVEPGLAPTLWPWIEIARTIAGGAAAATSGNPWHRLATGAADPGAARSAVEMADGFVTLLDESGSDRWVLHIDDLHWADRATIDVMRLVIERLGGRQVLVLGALRPPETVPDALLGDLLGPLQRAAPTTRIRMQPLDTDGVAQLMEITAGVAPSAEVAGRVRARAAGNPLFVTELARLAGERGLADDSVVPDAIRDVVRSRLALLPERATAELQVAAVLGERFDLRTAMAASERDADGCLEALDAAIVTRILVPEADGFRFAHALVRDAVLAEISPLRLARLHHRAAEAILATHGDGPDEAEPIAHHRLASSAFGDPVEAARAAVRASDVARWRSALDTAERFADRALEVLADVPRTAEVGIVQVRAMEAIVDVSRRRNSPAEAAAMVERVTALAARTGGDGPAALSLFLNWGPVDETDDLTEIAEATERARELAERTTDRYAVLTTRFMLAGSALLLGRLDEAAEHVRIVVEASGVTTASEPPENVPQVILPAIAAMVEAARGNAAAAREHAHQRAAAWMSRRREVDPTAAVALTFNRALVEALLGEPEAVLEVLGEGRAGFDAPEFVLLMSAACEVLSGWARARLGDPVGVEAARVAIAEVDRGPERILRSCLRTFAGEAHLVVGDPAAVDVLAEARREAEQRGELWWLSETIRLQAEADARFGDGDRVAALLDEAESLARRQGARTVLDRIARSREASRE